MMEKTTEEEMFSQVELIEDVKEVEGDRKPRLGEPGWSDYVVSLLVDKELATVPGKTTKLPRTDGLRRVCSAIFGEVLISKAHPTHVLNTENGLVTVVAHELVIKKYGSGQLLEVWGLADCRQDCLTYPYNQHVTANASTKALGRAFRDAMQLQVVVAEEMNSINDFDNSGDPEDAQLADDNQKKAIKMLCKKAHIDVEKFIKLGAFPHNSIDNVYKGTARKMISVLNGYHSDENSIPENIKV